MKAEFVSGVGNHYNKPDCVSFRHLEIFMERGWKSLELQVRKASEYCE